MDDLVIRPLAEGDAEAFWKFRLEALERAPESFAESAEEHRAMPPAELARRLGQGGAEQFVMGAFAGGKLAGTAGFFRERRSKARHKGHIWGVYVAESARRRGLGRRLMLALLERIRSTGVEQVTLTVATEAAAARALYRSLGFRTYGTEPRAMCLAGRTLDEELMILRF